MGARMIAVGVALCVACQEPERQMPPAKLAGGRVVDLIPLSLSGETWQDAEPFLALYASNPKLLAASAFTPNPGGSASATAPIFVSDDGGDSWTLRNTLPSQSMTADITHAVGGSPPVLYAGIMRVPGFPLNELKASRLLLARGDDAAGVPRRHRSALRPHDRGRERRSCVCRPQRFRCTGRAHRHGRRV